MIALTLVPELNGAPSSFTGEPMSKAVAHFYYGTDRPNQLCLMAASEFHETHELVTMDELEELVKSQSDGYSKRVPITIGNFIEGISSEENLRTLGRALGWNV